MGSASDSHAGTFAYGNRYPVTDDHDDSHADGDSDVHTFTYGDPNPVTDDHGDCHPDGDT